MAAMTAAPDSALPTSAPQAADIDVFAGAVADGKTTRAIKALQKLLLGVDPHASLLERESMLVGLCAWLRSGGRVEPIAGRTVHDPMPVRRLFLLVRALEQFPALREKTSRLLQGILAEQTAEGLFARMGIPGDRGLWTETLDRLSHRLMPQPLDEQEITHLLARTLPARHDPDWIAAAPVGLIASLIAVLRSPVELSPSRMAMPSILAHEDHSLGAMPLVHSRLSAVPTRRFSIWAPFRVALVDAIVLLAMRVTAAGLSDAIRARSPVSPLRESPFFGLPRVIDQLLATHRNDVDEMADVAAECQGHLLRCRAAVKEVVARLEAAGVSVDVVYRLDLIERSLDRIELLLGLLMPQAELELAEKAQSFVCMLLRERRRELSLVDVLRTNTRMLARKVIERAGQTGEHYITVSAREWFVMFLRAFGGGVLTAVTTTLKFVIGRLHRPPLQEALLAATNYAGSFLMMQLVGFTLATKQSSMTGAALAGAIKTKSRDAAALVTTMARMTRSQLAAAAGNVGGVIPGALAVDYAWQRFRGGHVIDAEYANKVLASLHPTESGTLPYAALTGVILWLSSLCAGWLENWAVYRRLPEAIAEHRVSRIVGTRVTEWASRVFARNIAGVGGNIAIGLMLGFPSVIGQFAGVPIDVRHVTLSTGSVTMAMCALGGDAFSTPAFHGAVVGIVCILALNILVSFTCATVVAMRARDVSFLDGLRMLGAIVVGFFRQPLRFFVPVGDKAPPTEPHA
jgi:site-specific recombinase